MKRFGWLLFAAAGCAWMRPLEEHSVTGTLRVGDLERTFVLHLPPSLPAEKPAPVLLVFHGGGGTGQQIERFTEFSPLSDRQGFIVAYPDGIGKNWYDGREVEGSRAHREKIDDLAFIDELLVEVARRHPVDEKRIFATGISNGGFFSHWLAAHRSEKIAAIAPVAGGMAPVMAESFRPAKPVSVLVIQGTEDPIVPYGGGELKYGRGKTIPTLDAVRLWAKHDRCGGARDDEVQDMDPNDGTTTLRTAWRDGQDGTDVILYTVKGGGHTWPGGSQYLPVSVIGRVSRDFSATEMIWGFFAGHPKR